MCVRPVSGRPQSASGFWLSSTTLFASSWPLAVMPRFARDRASVYDVWNCDPRPKRVIHCVCSEWYVDSPVCVQMPMLLLPKTPNWRTAGRPAGREHELPPIVDAVAVDVAVEHLVGHLHPQQVVAVVGDVADFDRCSCGTPRAGASGSTASCAASSARLPGRASARPRLEAAAEASAVESNVRAPLTVDTNGGLVAMLSAGVEPLAQEELADARPESGLAVTRDVPGDPEPRREVVVVLLHQRAVRAIGSAPGAGLLARVRAGNLEQAVARIVAQRRIEQRRDEAGDLVVVRVRVEEERIPQAVVDASRCGKPATNRRRRTRGRASAVCAERLADGSENPHDMSFSRKFARTLPVSLSCWLADPPRPRKPSAAGSRCRSCPRSSCSTLTSTPAFTKCLPNTRV